MSSELIINSSRDKSRIGLLKDKKLVEFHQESDETKFNVGDIYAVSYTHLTLPTIAEV